MKIVRCKLADEIFYGVVDDGMVERIQGTPFCPDSAVSGERIPLSSLTLLTPCCPTKAICVGLNYRDHAREMTQDEPGEPLLFLKPPSALLPPGGEIIYPPQTQDLQYEAELAVVIGRQARDITPEEAPEYILGYTCANDVTARDLQHHDGQWTRAKGFDTFLPLGPWIETDLDPSHLSVSLTLNGETKQHSTTASLLFGVMELVSFASSVMTLEPGDVLLTGTPSGVGPMAPGDRVAVTIEGIGSLENTVARR